MEVQTTFFFKVFSIWQLKTSLPCILIQIWQRKIKNRYVRRPDEKSYGSCSEYNVTRAKQKWSSFSGDFGLRSSPLFRNRLRRKVLPLYRSERHVFESHVSGDAGEVLTSSFLMLGELRLKSVAPLPRDDSHKRGYPPPGAYVDLRDDSTILPLKKTTAFFFN